MKRFAKGFLILVALLSIAGAQIERKRFSLAVHYRNVDDPNVKRIELAVNGAIARRNRLALALGKKVFEIRPAFDWDKGHAVRWLLDRRAEVDGIALTPLYIGDDITDEDAFRMIREDGIGIVVGPLDRPTEARYALRDTDEVQAFLDRMARPKR